MEKSKKQKETIEIIDNITKMSKDIEQMLDKKEYEMQKKYAWGIINNIKKISNEIEQMLNEKLISNRKWCIIMWIIHPFL